MIFHKEHLQTCFEWKVTLNQLLGWSGPLTHRQAVMLEAWREAQWNHPDRHDYYVMMLAAIQARANSKSPQSIQPRHFKLVFSRSNVKLSPEERKQRIAFSKGAWSGAAGGMKRMTRVDMLTGRVLQAAEIGPKVRPFQGKRRANSSGTGDSGNQDDPGPQGTQAAAPGSGGDVQTRPVRRRFQR